MPAPDCPPNASVAAGQAQTSPGPRPLRHGADAPRHLPRFAPPPSRRGRGRWQTAKRADGGGATATAFPAPPFGATLAAVTRNLFLIVGAIVGVVVAAPVVLEYAAAWWWLAAPAVLRSEEHTSEL